MPVDPIWWLALGVQCLAVPGTFLPVLPGLLWLPLGAGLWCWHVGWSSGWPVLLLAASWADRRTLTTDYHLRGLLRTRTTTAFEPL